MNRCLCDLFSRIQIKCYLFTDSNELTFHGTKSIFLFHCVNCMLCIVCSKERSNNNNYKKKNNTISRIYSFWLEFLFYLIRFVHSLLASYFTCLWSPSSIPIILDDFMHRDWTIHPNYSKYNKKNSRSIQLLQYKHYLRNIYSIFQMAFYLLKYIESYKQSASI